MRVAIYTRVSTDEQQTSIENQQNLFNKVIEENNWEHYKTYVDEGISGTKGYKRIDWKKLIQDGKERKYDILLTKSFSRFGRNQSETLVAIKELRAVGVRIIFLEGNLDSDRDSSKFGLFAWLAEQEAQQTSERLMVIWDKYNNEGIIHVCKPPYGYDYNDELRNFIVNPVEAYWVRQIFQWYIEGYGYNKIAKMLEESQVNTKVKGKWAGNTIRVILQNEGYIGTLVQGKSKTIDVTINQRKKIHKDNWFKHENNHEPIIDEDTFLKVQELNKIRSNKAKDAYINGGKKQSNSALFSNLLVCGECKSPMTIKRKKRLRNYSPFYACMNYDIKGKAEAGHVSNFYWEKNVAEFIKLQFLKLKKNDYAEIINAYNKVKEKNINYESQLEIIDSKINEWVEKSLTIKLNNSNKQLYNLQMTKIEDEINKLNEVKKELEKIPFIKNNYDQILINRINNLSSKPIEEWKNWELKEILNTIEVFINGDIVYNYLYLNS